MAVIPNNLFPSKTTAPSLEYPYGGAQDVSSPSDGTGTPWIAVLINDIFGFQQALLSAAGITPSGTPDQVGASQYLDAINTVVGNNFLPIDGSQNLLGNLIISNNVVTSSSMTLIPDNESTRSFAIDQTNDGTTRMYSTGDLAIEVEGNAGTGGGVLLGYKSSFRLRTYNDKTKLTKLSIGELDTGATSEFTIGVTGSNAEFPEILFNTKGLGFNGNVIRTHMRIKDNSLILGNPVDLVNTALVHGPDSGGGTEGQEVATTALPANGGLFVNNLSTGTGMERVLTTSDAGGGGGGGLLTFTSIDSDTVSSYTVQDTDLGGNLSIIGSGLASGLFTLVFESTLPEGFNVQITNNSLVTITTTLGANVLMRAPYGGSLVIPPDAYVTAVRYGTNGSDSLMRYWGSTQ